MLWLFAPPSDHDENVFDVPPSVCGVGALTELLDFWITVTTNGVTAVAVLTASESPDGLDAKVRLTVFGFSWTLDVARRARGVRRGQLQLEVRRIAVVRRVERAARDACPALHRVRVAVPDRRAVVDDQRPGQRRRGQRSILVIGGVPENEIGSPTA